MLLRSPAEAQPLPLEAVLERVPLGLCAPALRLKLLESRAMLLLLRLVHRSKRIHLQPLNGAQGLPLLKELRLHRLELGGRCLLPRRCCLLICRFAHTANGGRRYRLLMGRLLHLQRPLGFAVLLRVLHPERASLPLVLRSLNREPPRRLQVGEFGDVLGRTASLSMRLAFRSSHLQLLHKRSVLRFAFSCFHLQLLLKCDNVRVGRAQLLIQRGDGPPHFRDEIKRCVHNATPICKGARKLPPNSHQKIT